MSSADVYGPWSGQVMSSMREGCRNAFLEGERRLVEAMFNCQVQTSQVKITQVFHVGLVGLV